MKASERKRVKDFEHWLRSTRDHAHKMQATSETTQKYDYWYGYKRGLERALQSYEVRILPLAGK